MRKRVLFAVLVALVLFAGVMPVAALAKGPKGEVVVFGSGVQFKQTSSNGMQQRWSYFFKDYQDGATGTLLEKGSAWHIVARPASSFSMPEGEGWYYRSSTGCWEKRTEISPMAVRAKLPKAMWDAYAW